MIWNDLKDIFRMKIKVMREIPYSILNTIEHFF